MKKFSKDFIDPEFFRNGKRKPDFSNILSVLNKKAPPRPTLFEFFMNGDLSDQIAGGETDVVKRNILTFKNAGYDYVTSGISEFGFPAGETSKSKHGDAKTYSLNDTVVIKDRASFEKYKWVEVEDCDFSALEEYAKHMPDGMKLMVSGPGGVLENAIRVAGYDNLCYMTDDDPALCRDIFDAVGSRILKYYERCVPHPVVGILMSNDDWGFKTQTMLSPKQMREYVFPWHRRYAELAHKYGKPAVLHSCGCFVDVMEDVIEGIGFDGKHSYEDAIEPVESIYERYAGRIAILGGLDLDFICRSEPEQVYDRAVAMLERSAVRGGYGLGSGNSIPTYVPLKNYYAMIAAAVANE